MSQAANNWYILYTAFKEERVVKQQVEMLGIECWLPLYTTPRVWSDTTRMVDMPLYPSFLMVRCTEETVRELPAKVGGNVHVLFYEGKPVVIREAKVEALQDLLKLVSGDML